MKRKILILLFLASVAFNCSTFEKVIESKEAGICREKLDEVSPDYLNKPEELYSYYADYVHNVCRNVQYQSHPAYKNTIVPVINGLLERSVQSKSKLELEKNSLELAVNDSRKIMDSEEKLVNGKEKDLQLTALKNDIEKLSLEIHKKKQKRKEELKSKLETLANDLDFLKISVKNNCNVRSTTVYFVSKQFIKMYGIGTCGEREFNGEILLLVPVADDVPGIDLNLYSKMSLNPSVTAKRLIAATPVDAKNMYYRGISEQSEEHLFTHQRPKDYNAKIKKISKLEGEILELNRNSERSANEEAKNLSLLEQKADKLQKQISSYSKAKDVFTESQKKYDELVKKIKAEDERISDYRNKLQ